MNREHYGIVDTEVLTRLRRIVGEQFVVTDEEKMEQYSHDEVAEALKDNLINGICARTNDWVLPGE